MNDLNKMKNKISATAFKIINTPYYIIITKKHFAEMGILAY